MENNQISFSKNSSSKPKPMTIMLGVAIFVIIIIALLFSFVVSPMIVSGTSMEDTLADGALVIVCKVFDDVAVDDIIVYTRTSDNYQVVKRVVGIAGDTFRIDQTDGLAGSKIYSLSKMEEAVIIQSVNLSADQALFLTSSNGGDAFTVGENQLFTVGDNYNDSFDGRNYGCITLDSVVGVVLFK